MKDPIVQVGDPVLRADAKPVTKADIGSPALGKILKHMSAALAKEEFGVAIAAPQIGEPLRIFVISGRVFDEPEDEESGSDVTDNGLGAPPKRGSEDLGRGVAAAKKHADMVFINPEITKLSRKKREMSEGCLSVRGKYGTVVRSEKCSVRALDEHGKLFTYNGSGLVAQIFQHEVDHLNGTLYIDKAATLEDDSKRAEIREKHRA